MANVKIQTPPESACESAAESLGWQLRAALPPLRLHSVSIFNPAGDVLWLSEGVLGPDEQSFAAEALSDLHARPSATHRNSDFLDGRGAVFLPIRSPQSRLAGAVMILVDAKALATGNLSTRILTTAVNGLLERLGRELPPPQRAQTDSPLDGDDAVPDEVAQLDPVGEITLEILAPQDVEEILTFELPQITLLAEHSAVISATDEDSAHAAMPAARSADAAASTPAPGQSSDAVGLQVEEFATLRSGGRLRRFHVVSSAEETRAQLALEGPLDHAGSSRDAVERLVSEIGALLEWVGAHARPQGTSVSFSLTVPAAALGAEDLPERIVDLLGPAGADAAAIGFELEEALYVRHRSEIDRLVRAVEPLGCFIVVDDFTFDSEAVELLRSRTLSLVKVHPQLIAAALRDKLAQARIVAISQAARVLGIHCAAKEVAGQAARRWLTAAGFDLALGPLFGAARPLAALADELE
jgi:EAL domain-containing protein (putative c-di-GMP-specific phosphodiesterase class I)